NVTYIASWCGSSSSTTMLLSGLPVVGAVVVASAEFGVASISSTSAANCGDDTRASGAGVITSVAICGAPFLGVTLAAQLWWFLVAKNIATALKVFRDIDCVEPSWKGKKAGNLAKSRPHEKGLASWIRRY